MDIKKIEKLLETKDACDIVDCCEQCKYRFEGCYNDLNESELIEIIRELYKKVKVDTDWKV